MTTIQGYEVQGKASTLTRKVLKKLRETGVAILTYDDSPEGIQTFDQLRDIAGNIGLKCHESPYEIVLIDEESHPEFIIKSWD